MKDLLNNLKQRLLTGWNFLRVIRLALALIITLESWFNSELIFAVLGGFLAFQAMFNYGCCGAEGCDIDQRMVKTKPSQTNEITTFEEVK